MLGVRLITSLKSQPYTALAGQKIQQKIIAQDTPALEPVVFLTGMHVLLVINI